MKLNLGQLGFCWLLLPLFILLSSARSTPVRVEEDGIKTYQICNACMDKDFPKFAALYQNTDIGRQLGIPQLEGIDCSKGKFLRVKCNDACIIVKILTKNGKGELLSYEVMTDCSTSLMEDHPSLQNRDIAHIRENITFTDNFDQIKTDVVYSFVMGNDQESENMIIQQELKLEEPKTEKEIFEEEAGKQLNAFRILFLTFFILLMLIFAFYTYPIWDKMAQTLEDGFRRRSERNREVHATPRRGPPPARTPQQTV